MITWFLDRYRGTRGVFGWIVRRADVRWLKRGIRIAHRIAKEERGRL